MSGDPKKLLDRMLGKKFYVVIWRGKEGVDIGPALREHLEFMIGLEKRGVLFASGPLSGIAGDGLTILRTPSIDEARAIAEQDPFIAKGLRSFDLREWTMMEGSIGLKINCSDRLVELI